MSLVRDLAENPTCGLNMGRNKREREAGGVLPSVGMPITRAKDTLMKQLVMRVALAVTAAAIFSPARAQIPPSAAAPPQWSPAAYFGGAYHPYPFPAPTPRDAYRDGLINRWELERFEGPTPPALQGPSPDGNRGGNGGGGDRGN
jgi:hypothetical protein